MDESSTVAGLVCGGGGGTKAPMVEAQRGVLVMGAFSFLPSSLDLDLRLLI